MKYYFLAFKKMFNYKDKASPKEFWLFFLFQMIVTALVSFFGTRYGLPKTSMDIYRVVMIYITFSVGYRRLKDAGYNS